MTRHEMIELLGWHHQTMTDEQRDTLSRVEHIVKIAVLREREACAKVCDDYSEFRWSWWKARADPLDQGASDAADELAQRIRSRK